MKYIYISYAIISTLYLQNFFIISYWNSVPMKKYFSSPLSHRRGSEEAIKIWFLFHLNVCVRMDFLHILQWKQLITAEWMQKLIQEVICISFPLCVRCVSTSCLTLCDPMGCSPPGSSVQGISQARILEWVAISYSRGSSRPRDQTHFFCVSWPAGRFSGDHWATREVQLNYHKKKKKKK